MQKDQPRGRLSIAVMVMMLMIPPLYVEANSDELQTATDLTEQGSQLYVAGKYAEAIPLIEQALAIRQRVLGPEDLTTAESLDNLAGLYRAIGNNDQAESLYLQALGIVEKGSDPEPTVASLNNLASFYRTNTAYDKAEPLLKRAIAIRERSSGREAPATATSLNTLALLYHAMGLYDKAEPLFIRALAIRKKTLGPDNPATATSLNNLAALYRATGDYTQAEQLYKEALAIRKKVLRPNDPATATVLNNLGELFHTREDYGEAESHYEQALAILDVDGQESPALAKLLDNLAQVYRLRGSYDKAEPFHQRALESMKKVLRPDDPSMATTIHNQAAFYQALGAYDKAEPLYKEALTIRERVLSREHPLVAMTLQNSAELAWSQGRWSDAQIQFQRALQIEDMHIRRQLVQGDESRKRMYMATLAASTQQLVGFATDAPANNVSGATSLGLEVLLQRKGRVLDVLADTLTRLRAGLAPTDRPLLENYQVATTKWATLSTRGPETQPIEQYQRQLADLQQHVATLEAQLSSRSSQFRALLEPVDLTQVQRALPAHSVLLEWTRYSPFNPKAIKQEPRWGAPHYAVYVLKSSGDPVVIDVGEAQAIDKLVMGLLEAVRRPSRQQAVAGLARELDQLLVQPLRPHLESIKQVLIAPDGQLNLLPFGVLQDAPGHYLTDQYEITYLTSGRDLLRPAIPAETSRPSLLVADPAFDLLTPPTGKNKAAGSPSPSSKKVLRSGHYNALPGTAKEAQELKRLLQLTPNQVLTKARATETAVKQVQSPRIFHLATHGIFEPDLPEASPATSRGAALAFLKRGPAPSGKNPLLRSWLVLAGANQGQSGTDDGLLTALEVSSLDLTGTQLAVLSACETAVGQVQNGEGVYGLRRALVLAGVRTQVVSLWKVDDTATQAFMGYYYRHILNGRGRSAALRATQQDMRENREQPQWADPYYWAAFVVIGESTPLPTEAGARSVAASHRTKTSSSRTH